MSRKQRTILRYPKLSDVRLPASADIMAVPSVNSAHLSELDKNMMWHDDTGFGGPGVVMTSWDQSSYLVHCETALSGLYSQHAKTVISTLLGKGYEHVLFSSTGQLFSDMATNPKYE